ncbi:hypothetical protein JCM33374_g412 [Metschnikowia sp. JCM 33374]|nr:hypothetical protein JCM33374_g412 [Metschnikowia sp. JCM 33374]
MNFQPSDYLSDLNLVFDNADVSPVEEASHNANLDFFSQADFFDLDVFSNDYAAREKHNSSMKLPQTQLASQAHLTPTSARPEVAGHLAVKQEEADPTVVGPSGTESVSDRSYSTFSPNDVDISRPYGSWGESSPGSSVGGMEPVDEIKRRRNTAASARFRIKKKMKEKQMEQQARELQDRLGMLEKKLRTLEMENKCLRQLIVEKTEKKNCDLLASIKKRSLGDNSDGGEGTGFAYTN